MLLLDTQHHGLLIAQVFFGLCGPAGVSGVQVGLVPRPLAAGSVLAEGCYLVDVLTALPLPDLNQLIHPFIEIPCVVAEIWMVGYLLLIGVKNHQDTNSTHWPDHPRGRLTAASFAPTAASARS